MFHRIISLMVLFVIASGCAGAPAAPSNQSSIAAQSVAAAQPDESTQVPEVEPTATLPAAPTTTVEPAQIPTAAPTLENTAVPAQPTATTVPAPLGPDDFPEGVSPLSGLPVANSANLQLAPALVSVTNFPPTARPQAGLSYSPYVFEIYIGEGMTRFLAVFYGDYPKKGENNGIALSDDRIGPIRSGRIAYEPIRRLYNGFLVMSSGSSVVLPSLGSYTNIFGDDNGDINSNLIPATRLEEIASKNPKRLDTAALSGQRYDASAPEGGKSGRMLWIPYSFLNQVIWRYDEASGAYHRYQDNADGKTFIQATDRLNNQPITYENVVVLFADHTSKAETLIDINLLYINRKPALLFRDGKVYQIYWTTANGQYEKTTGHVRPIRFIDGQGNPFPLKPGQTWVQIVQDPTRYNETVDSELYSDLQRKVEPGSGNWAVHFYAPVLEK